MVGYREEAQLGPYIELLIPEAARPYLAKLPDEFFELPTPQPMGRGRHRLGVTRTGDSIPIEIGLDPIVMLQMYGLEVLAVAMLTSSSNHLDQSRASSPSSSSSC